ncbi:MAG: 4-(cytidine 5'-diphospho)-2-C-methyl-D-erythritol kinase [Candidatus Latescibacterota bacterium]|nr:4-(cytidine 5'-diphospho)-2-C-methyl-D-erythritol kinase [Candidatus Latescibacterota bacterium]
MQEQSLTHIRETAPAKLNLGLKVLGRRADGFHEIAGVFQAVNLCDEVLVSPADRLQLSCSDPDLESPDNLALRAAELYLSEVAGPPCRIEVTKRIPAGAGLGGGSADAAAVLRALNKRAGLPLDPNALAALGEQLGSDVPFAVIGGTAWVTGRGDRVQPLHWLQTNAHYLLVFPQVQVDTAWAYGQLQSGPYDEASVLSESTPYLILMRSVRGGRVDAKGLFAVLENDFQSSVERAKPIVARASSLLADTQPLAQSMSGSGSTVYGIYDDRPSAQRAADKLSAAGLPVFLCRAMRGR